MTRRGWFGLAVGAVAAGVKAIAGHARAETRAEDWLTRAELEDSVFDLEPLLRDEFQEQFGVREPWVDPRIDYIPVERWIIRRRPLSPPRYLVEKV